MQSAKRQRSSSSASFKPPHPAVKSLKASIALLATLDLPASAFDALLASLSTVHKDLTGEVEDLDVKPEEGLAVPAVANWDWTSVVGAGEAQNRVLEDLRAGKELMDSVGITVRPLSTDGQTVDLSRWEVALPGPAGTDWEGGLYKMHVSFPEGTTVPTLFHPNAYPSGTFACPLFLLQGDEIHWKLSDKPRFIAPRWYWGDEREKPKEGWTAADMKTQLRRAPAHLRLPKLFESCRAMLAHPNFDDPAQLEAYTMGNAKVRQIAVDCAPTADDILYRRRQAGQKV
ncbi:hypothetical protein RQP46_004618 [Phenoliferia psychrophenolica]